MVKEEAAQTPKRTPRRNVESKLMTTPVKIDKASQLPKPAKSKVKIFSDQNTLPKPKVKMEPESATKPKRGRKVALWPFLINFYHILGQKRSR